MRRTTIAVAGARIAAWERSGTVSGRWIVLLHGAGLDHREFLEFADAIDPSWHLAFIDLRGHGQSVLDEGAPATLAAAVEDVTAVLKALNVEKCVLLGHSFGGNIAQEFSYRHPRQVSALITIGSPGQQRSMRAGEVMLMRAAGALYRVLPWRAFAAFSGRWSSKRPATRRYVRDCMIATGRSVYIDLGLSGFAEVHPVAPSQLPTLLVRGQHDMPQALDAVYSDLVAANPACSIAVIAGVGHQVMQDAPAALAKPVQAFLDQLSMN